MGLTLSAVYPEYFPNTPTSLSKGSSTIKGIFKGQYQVYPPIRTITLSKANFFIEPINKYVIVQVFYEGNSWYYVITNTDYIPGFRIWLYRSYTVSGSYGSSTVTISGYVDISGGSRTLGYKYSFTPTMTSGSTGLYGSGFTYGIGTTSGGGSYNSTYQDISGYRVCAYCKSPSDHLRGNTIYKWNHQMGINYSDKIYCAPNAFSITYQTGSSTYNTINVPATNNGTSSFGYLYGSYFWLYDSRMPRIPAAIQSANDPKLKIYNISATPSKTNSWHYLSAYFNNKTFSPLTNYYKNLTGDTSNINLFDYGVRASQLTTYRYDIPTGKDNVLWQIKSGSQYEWDLDNCTATFNLYPFGNNYANGFYILGIYLSVPGNSFYVTFAGKQGGNTTGSLSNYNANNLSVGGTNGYAGTIDWGLNEPNKFDIDITGTTFKSCSVTLSHGHPDGSNGGVAYDYKYWSPITITLTGLQSWSSIFQSGQKIYAEFGVDWFWTWATARYDNYNYTSANSYFVTPPSSSGDYKDFTVYCICWSGYYKQQSNQISIKKLGTFRVNAKASSGVGTIEIH